jgi:predicted PhzF superfamily epimerase YddE/YHI9
VVSGAVKKLGYLGTGGINMPSMPKLGWYGKKKAEKEEVKAEEPKNDLKEQLEVPSDALNQDEDVPDFTVQVDEEETVEATKPSESKLAEAEQEFTIVLDLANVKSIDEMNDLMFKISSHLVNDRQKLSRWIAGIQYGYASQFVQLQ